MMHSEEQPSTSSLTFHDTEKVDRVNNQVPQRLFDLIRNDASLPSEVLPWESKADPSSLFMFSSSFLSYYSNLLRQSSRIVSDEIDISATNDWADDAIKNESMLSIGPFDQETNMCDDMDFDEILSTLSDDDSDVSCEFGVDNDNQKSCWFLPGNSVRIQPNEDEKARRGQTNLLEMNASTLHSFQCRLHACMLESLRTQVALQEWDRLNGLPASHSRTMINTARSRKQLQDGVILKKWNGSPLL